MNVQELRDLYRQVWNVDSYGWELTFRNIEIAPYGGERDCWFFIHPVKIEDQTFIDEYNTVWEQAVVCREPNLSFDDNGVVCDREWQTDWEFCPSLSREGLRLVAHRGFNEEPIDHRCHAYFRNFNNAYDAWWRGVEFMVENYQKHKSDEEWDNYEFFRTLRSNTFFWKDVDFFAITQGLCAHTESSGYVGFFSEPDEFVLGDVGETDYSYFLNKFCDFHISGGGYVFYPFASLPYLMTGLPLRLGGPDQRNEYEPFGLGKAIQFATVEGNKKAAA